jgi:hypothetical protein
MYEQEVKSKSQQELESEIATQAWQVARIAATKHQWSQYAYVCVILFLVCWAASRISLSFVG